jgi:transposase
MSRGPIRARAGESRLGRAGLPAWLRACVLLHPDFADSDAPAAQIAADLGGFVSERSVQRYRERYAARGTVARSQGTFGPEPVIKGEAEALLRGLVALQADQYLDELTQLLNAVYSPASTFTWRQVDDALRRMRFVLVRKEWRNMNADPEEQRRWFTTPPVGLSRERGILGVPTALMVDIDETVVRLGGLRRTRARTLRGTRAVCRDVNDYAGVAYSIILATDINVGVVAYQVLPRTINRDAFLLFLYFELFPKLGASPRFLLMDNASSHHGEAIEATCAEQGHTALYRPAYSPHLAWIEHQNSVLKSQLRRRYAALTHENIVDEIERVIRECITPEMVRASAAHCHYYVPGYPFQPWLGD